MTALIPKAERLRRAEEMRRLSDDDRRAAIATSDNVLGFTEFSARAKQVQLSEAYRKPIAPEGVA